MTVKKTKAPTAAPSANSSQTSGKAREETPLEGFAGICSMLVVITFVYAFIAQNFVIPSGSMENTLLIGDHLVVDRITLAPSARWMPLVYYRQPRRGDVVVFKKPVPDLVNGRPKYQYLVKRLIGLPGDHIHLHNGIVYINGVAQAQPHAQPTTPANYQTFLDEFPSVPPTPVPYETPETWAVDFPNHVVDGDLVVPVGDYFMMGDNRHSSEDSRYWGFVPRGNIAGRPLFNYWSFKATEADYDNLTTLHARLAWIGHVALHFFTDTRWLRTFHVIR
ncbi:MAG TPA: signal peptidase I [Terracidiphilus sp.]|nr:signal peptidase I [Terracidiphilus sp.]